MVHRILKTAIHPFSEFIFEYLLVLPLPAAQNAKNFFKNSNSSGNNAYYCTDDGRFCHCDKVSIFFCSRSVGYMAEKGKEALLTTCLISNDKKYTPSMVVLLPLR